jgi:hypothetical protein
LNAKNVDTKSITSITAKSYTHTSYVYTKNFGFPPCEGCGN